MIKEIDGGITAPKGFRAGGINCGIKAKGPKKDLALILSDVQANVAAVYTKNKVKGAPIYVTQQHIKNGRSFGCICNSGNANTCNADGMEIANKMCKLIADATNLSENDFIIASTGVIGQPLPIAPIVEGVLRLVKALSYDGSDDAVNAIMTTDLAKKEVAVEFEVGGKICRMGVIAKGSGMIAPNMATMLSFLTTDVAITTEMLQKALSNDVKSTYNMVTVDGDTSTNDMVCILANGLAENVVIATENKDYYTFCEALSYLNTKISKKIAQDGEGATKLLEVIVLSAPTVEAAQVVAKSVVSSSLLKAMIFGEDANCGRILCAIGYAETELDIFKVDVAMKSVKGSIDVGKSGTVVTFSEDIAKTVLSEKEITIVINLNQGTETATAWGCDLTYDYVKINGDYRS